MFDATSQGTKLHDTGERLLPAFTSPWAAEHLHRYALARQWVCGKVVLDVASGEGYGSRLLAEVAESIMGVDVDPAAVSHAAKTYIRSNLSYRHGSATALPLDDASVDAVVSFETLEHLDDHDGMLREVKRVLRPGGLMVMSTPDKRFYPDKRHYVEGEVPTNPFHVRELTLDEFKALVGRHFAQSTFLFQRLVYGSLVCPERAADAAGFTDFRGDFGRIEAFDGVPDPVFVIALASDGYLPPVGGVSVQDGWRVLASQEAFLRRVLASPSLRVGRALTWPVRRLMGRG